MAESSDRKSAFIPGAEIAELFRSALRGEAKIFIVGVSWSEICAANAEVRIDGYKLAVFNDDNKVDHVDSATAPDGRIADFDDWYIGKDKPVDLLTDEEQERLETLMEAAEVIAEG